MAKKNNILGVLVTAAAATAAVCTIAYVFRDKIADFLARDDEDDFDDFYFDDSDDFYDEEVPYTANRGYVNISPKANEEEPDTSFDDSYTKVSEYDEGSNDDTFEDFSDAADEADEETETEEEKEDVTEIPTIAFSGNDEKPTAYENEGLSDVYEDPDVLADSDRLDF